MNQGKIWLVVKPTIGLPLFLGGVAVIALCVHAAVISHADWYTAYYNGNFHKAKATASADAPAVVVAEAPAAKAAPAK